MRITLTIIACLGVLLLLLYMWSMFVWSIRVLWAIVTHNYEREMQLTVTYEEAEYEAITEWECTREHFAELVEQYHYPYTACIVAWEEYKEKYA